MGRTAVNTPQIAKAKGKYPSQLGTVTTLFPDVASQPEPPIQDPPKWLDPIAKELWYEHIADYRWRGQKIRGTEKSLAHYCSVEAKMIAAWKKNQTPSINTLNVYLRLAIQFYDTPASQRVVIGKGTNANRFERNGSNETDQRRRSG